MKDFEMTKATGTRESRIVVSSLETDLYTPLSNVKGNYPTIAEALALTEKKSLLKNEYSWEQVL